MFSKSYMVVTFEMAFLQGKSLVFCGNSKFNDIIYEFWDFEIDFLRLMTLGRNFGF